MKPRIQEGLYLERTTTKYNVYGYFDKSVKAYATMSKGIMGDRAWFTLLD